MPLFNENGECSLIEALRAYIPEVEELLNPGVREAQIIEAEKEIGFPFPDDFRQTGCCEGRRI
ncbi:hypothetical protein R70723_23020 [Paenibacillus sp. FSL R7-0273]|nr:hypothetical protein R70723_23020 [Paenibacillus sp. FSL R7-0273]OMF86323.1 hypothetical protein BK144_26375 [Paenibacillus sp. FSL R7-0273]